MNGERIRLFGNDGSPIFGCGVAGAVIREILRHVLNTFEEST